MGKQVSNEGENQPAIDAQPSLLSKAMLAKAMFAGFEEALNGSPLSS